ncbi:uncharacterized protein [Macrobrachium rosenbergii]|uniref:uncharacterized protein n=1 Tax=Macrobrachium rosenbergii TaxID=79674 RepID=UPI0034D57EAE
MGPQRASTKGGGVAPTPDIKLGSIPWLQEAPLPEEDSNSVPGLSTLMITGVAVKVPELKRSQLIAARHEDDELLPLREGAFTQEEHFRDLTKEGYLLEDGVLFRVSLGMEEPADITHQVVVVPRKLQVQVLQLAHDGLGGHFVVIRTTKLLEGRFYWPRWRSVKTYIASCPSCQIAGKPNEVVPKAPLQNIAPVSVPFQDVVIDFYTPEGRKKTKTGNTHTLSIIDWLTRYPEVIPVHSTSLKNAVRVLILFFCQFGFLATVQSDEGWYFILREFRDAIITHGINHLHSTPYHPESQGTIKCFHQTLGTTLSLLAEENGSSWEDNLPYALFAICQAPSETLGYSPFELLFAHSTRGPLDILYEAWAEPEKAAWAENLPCIQRNLRAAWDIAQAHEAASQEWTQFTGPHRILAKQGQLNYLVDCSKRRAKWLPSRSEENPRKSPRALSSKNHHRAAGPRINREEPKLLVLTGGAGPQGGGGDRLCIDFRKLNAVTKPEPYPLPIHSSMFLDSIGQAPFLSKIDLEKGYWQVPLSLESRPLTTFTTPSDHYQCKVMPFGLKNAPSCFQRLVNKVLAGIPSCVVHLDDIVIFAQTWEEHQRVLEQVLEALCRANLTVAEITYLGHIVGNSNLRLKDVNI